MTLSVTEISAWRSCISAFLNKITPKKKGQFHPNSTAHVQKSRSYILRQQACSSSKGRSTVEHWTCFESRLFLPFHLFCCFSFHVVCDFD